MRNNLFRSILVIVSCAFLSQSAHLADRQAVGAELVDVSHLRPLPVKDRVDPNNHHARSIYHQIPEVKEIDVITFDQVVVRTFKPQFGNLGWQNSIYAKELYDAIKEARWDCRLLAKVNLRFDKIKIEGYLFGFLNITDDTYFVSPPKEYNLAEVAIWITNNITHNWTHIASRGQERQELTVIAGFRTCKIGDVNALHMVFRDDGRGMDDIERVWSKRDIEASWRYLRRFGQYRGKGRLLTLGPLMYYGIGNIQISSKDKRVTYFFDGSHIIEDIPSMKGTEINVVIFPPVKTTVPVKLSVVKDVHRNKLRVEISGAI